MAAEVMSDKKPEQASGPHLVWRKVHGHMSPAKVLEYMPPMFKGEALNEVAKHKLTEDESKLSLGELVQKYPAP